MRKLLFAALLLAGSALLVSCGGGGGDGSGSTAATSTAPATVGLVMTDAHTDQWDKALVTITSVTLISDEGHQEIFSGEKEVDLLALREHVKLFAVKKGVKPGYYSKIRLTLKEQQKGEHLLLIDEDAVAPADKQWVKVPSSKVDLNPKDTIYIAPGAVVFASFDWDMEKSLKLTETGSGKWIMRPVIFVHIGTKPMFKKGLVRLSGIVETVGDLGFRLCSPPEATASSTDSKEFCVNVLVKDNTGVFDSNGEPRVDQDPIVAKGEELTVVGLLRRMKDDHDDYDDDDDDDYEHHEHDSPFSKHEYDDDDYDDDDDDHPKFLVSAIVVEVGPEGTWERVRGTVTAAVNSTTQQFELDPDPGQGYDDTTLLAAQLFKESRIFRLEEDGSLKEITAAEILFNDRAALDAVKLVSTGGTGPDLNVALLLARHDPATETLTGKIMSVSPLGLWVEIEGASCLVDTDPLTTKAFVLSDTGVKEVSVSDLPVGHIAVVTGTSDGCEVAEVIIAGPAPAVP
ncbi:MAG: DUF4382 domain-containing protein [Betaproteobacteria bacterium]|nr:MAG: DUF4382 domain-containing protein [Betaproteobacteria bacterium]